jgi:hypothetical protein
MGRTMMENGYVLILTIMIIVGLVLVLAMVLNNKFRSKTKIGPVEFELDADPAPRGAKITARNIKKGSKVINEGGGGLAEIKVQEDIIESTITNTAGNTKKD